MKKISITTILCLLGLFVDAQTYKNEFGFITENDSYLATLNDGYYTNGLFINFRRALEPEFCGEKLEKKIYEISIGQQMFTPYRANVPNPANQDRPFAGYLFAGGSLSNFYANESLLKLSAQIGTTGPHSLAQEAQKLIHDVAGFYTPSGWEYQIKNELALNLSAKYNRLLFKNSSRNFDIIGHSYINLGSTFSGVGIAPIFRIGRLNQLYHSALENAVIGHAKTAKRKASEFYFYAKPQINFVAYDATIQGSLFKHNSPVTFDIKPVVFEQHVGLTYSSNRFTIDFKAIFKTKEIKSVAKAQNYGSASLYYRFGKI